MVNTKFSYDLENNLRLFIIKEVGRRMMNNEDNVMKKDVMNDLAKYCEVGFQNIKSIDREVSKPSLLIALKIAEYFKVNVEDIFKLRK